MKKTGWMGALLALLSLLGCDAQRLSELEVGVATEADVRARFGSPENIWDGPGGTRVFEYNRQPAGHVNYMISLGPDGRMVGLRQVLTPANFERIQPGMRMEAVRQLLGKPAKITSFTLKREVHYDWRYLDTPNTSMLFTVVFDPDYRVLRTFSVLDPSASGDRN